MYRLKLLDTDTKFQTSPDAGHPDCLCSRCGQRILEGEMPFRFIAEDGSYEQRYHDRCLGVISHQGTGANDESRLDYDLDSKEDDLDSEEDELEADQEEELMDCGPCCICGISDPNVVQNILCLALYAPVPRTGWGCCQCGLPMDGALAVLCDDCLDTYSKGTDEIRFVVYGYIADKERVLYSSLSDQIFGHDPIKHPEDC